LVLLNLPVEIKSVYPLVTRHENRIVNEKVIPVAYLNCFTVVIFYNIIDVKINGHIFKKICVAFLFKNLDLWLSNQKFGRFELTEAE
jgi:hypothetical protein